MSDHDLLDSFAREAGRQVIAPEFDALVTTSTRRRRVVTAASGIAVAAVIGVVAVGLQTVDDSKGDTPGPSNTPTPTSSTPSGTTAQQAAAVVDDPSAFLLSAAVQPDRPEVRAVVWYTNSGRTAVAVTADGFETRSTMLLRSSPFTNVSAAGPDWFFVGQPQDSTLVASDGASRDVRVVATPSAVQPDEFLVQAYSGETLAVDPTAGVAHPITLPQHAHAVYGGPDLIWTIAYTASAQQVFHSSVDWSTDGGRTWSAHQLSSGPLAIYSAVPSDPTTMAVSLTGDVTVTPLTRIVSSSDGGATWRTQVLTGPATPGVSWTAALPDGSFLANVYTWSDTLAGHPSKHPIGLLGSVATDPFQLAPVHPHLPGDEQETSGSVAELVATAVDHGDLVLYAAGSARSSELLRSTEGGRTWTAVAAR